MLRPHRGCDTLSIETVTREENHRISKNIPINPKPLAQPINALFKLEAEIDETAARRRHAVFRVWCLVMFPDKAGVTVIARIDNFGPKRMPCQLLDEKGLPIHVRDTWRVTPEHCKPDPRQV